MKKRGHMLMKKRHEEEGTHVDVEETGRSGCCIIVTFKMLPSFHEWYLIRCFPLFQHDEFAGSMPGSEQEFIFIRLCVLREVRLYLLLGNK